MDVCRKLRVFQCLWGKNPVFCKKFPRFCVYRVLLRYVRGESRKKQGEPQKESAEHPPHRHGAWQRRRGKCAGGNARKKGSGGGERALPVLRTGGAVATGEIPRTKAPRKRHPIPSKSGKAYRGTVRIPPGATGGTQKGEATRGTMREDRGNPCDMTGNRSFSVWRGKNAPRVRRANRGGAFFVEGVRNAKNGSRAGRHVRAELRQGGKRCSDGGGRTVGERGGVVIRRTGGDGGSGRDVGTPPLPGAGADKIRCQQGKSAKVTIGKVQQKGASTSLPGSIACVATACAPNAGSTPPPEGSVTQPGGAAGCRGGSSGLACCARYEPAAVFGAAIAAPPADRRASLA